MNCWSHLVAFTSITLSSLCNPTVKVILRHYSQIWNLENLVFREVSRSRKYMNNDSFLCRSYTHFASAVICNLNDGVY